MCSSDLGEAVRTLTAGTDARLLGLSPGDLTVTHSDLGGGTFRFTLEIVHPRFGKLIRQSALFREAAS